MKAVNLRTNVTECPKLERFRITITRKKNSEKKTTSKNYLLCAISLSASQPANIVLGIEISHGTTLNIHPLKLEILRFKLFETLKWLFDKRKRN